MNLIIEMFSYPFMQRAVLVGLLVSLCAALLGVSLVLKNLSMIGDGLSHVAFGTMAVALVTNLAPLRLAVPVVMIAAFLLMKLQGRLRGDAAIAILSTGALAIGVMAVSMTPGVNIDLNSYMFGSILAIHPDDVLLSCLLSGAVLVLYILFYERIFSVTFDETFARASGVRASLYTLLVAALTAVTVVLGMRLMGAMLISSLIIFPAVTAMRLFRSFRGVVIASACVAGGCFLTGILLSYTLSTPAGASIVCTNLFCLCVFTLLGRIFRRKTK